mgnify:CR=1 FL=1
MRQSSTALALMVMAASLLVVSPVAAQDDGGTMSFGEEEAEETMTFGEEEASSDESLPKEEQKPVVGVVAVPGDAMDSSQRGRLKTRLSKAMQMVQDIELDTSPAVLNALQSRTIETCVTEPLCLGSVGRKAGVDRIVMARVKQKPGGLQLDIDYFNVEDKLFIKYKSVPELGNFKQVLNAVPGTVKQVFGIREPKEEPNYADTDSGKAKMIIAISSAVLSAGALTGGIVFGLGAKDLESELNSSEKSNGHYTELTQKQARQKLNKAQGKAATANIFYGLAGAFAVASGVLFIIDAGSDVDSGAQPRAGLFERIDVKPVFNRSGAGLSAGIDF